MFISHLDLEGLAASTITSYISGINHFQKSMGFKDLLDNPIVRKTILGLQKCGVKKTKKNAINLQTLGPG